MPKNRMVMFEWRTRDAAKLQHFYGGLFDWKFKKGGEGWQPVGTGNDEVEGGMVTVANDPNLPGGLICFFRVDELAKAEERVLALGGQVLVSQKQVADGRYSLFRDTDFNQVGLWEEAGKKKKAKKAEGEVKPAKADKKAAKAARKQAEKAAKAEKKAAKAARKQAEKAAKPPEKPAPEAKK